MKTCPVFLEKGKNFFRPSPPAPQTVKKFLAFSWLISTEFD
jgi:hypothetical protein